MQTAYTEAFFDIDVTYFLTPRKFVEYLNSEEKQTVISIQFLIIKKYGWITVTSTASWSYQLGFVLIESGSLSIYLIKDIRQVRV